MHCHLVEIERHGGPLMALQDKSFFLQLLSNNLTFSALVPTTKIGHQSQHINLSLPRCLREIEFNFVFVESQN